QAHWYSLLEAEHDNLRMALTFCQEDAAGGEKGLRLGGALQTFWEVRGHLSEGREHLHALLSHPGAQIRTRAHASALNGAGSLSETLGDCVSARTLYEESLEIKRELGDRQGIAGSLHNLGLIAKFQGDYDSARSLFEEALAINRETGNRG